MPIMDKITTFMTLLKEAVGIPTVIRSTISEGVSEGVADGINRNRGWIEHDAIKFVLLLIGLLFFCWGLVEIGDNAFPQYKGVTAIVIGLVAGLLIAFLSVKNSD
jgi:hypothetical protein